MLRRVAGPVSRRAQRHRQGSPARPGSFVKFQGSDGKTLTPDHRAKYTIEFAAAGAT